MEAETTMKLTLKYLLVAACLIAVATGRAQNSTNELANIEEVLKKAEKALIYGDRYGGLGTPGKDDAITVLGFIGGERAVAILLHYAEGEDNNNTRFNLIRALGWTGSPTAVPFLERMVQDKTNMYATRSQAAKMLRNITGKTYEIEKNEKDLEFEKNFRERLRLRSGTTEKPQSSVEKPLNTAEALQQIPGNNPNDKSHEMYKGKSVDEWIELLKTGKNEDRPEALMGINAHFRKRAFAGKPDPRSKVIIPELVRILQDQQEVPRMRSLALTAVDAIGPDASEAVPTLVGMLPKNPGIIRILKSIGPAAQAAVPALVKIFESNNGWSLDAAEALWQINQYPQAIPMMYATLQSEDVRTRRQAAIAIEKLGVDAKAAAPGLVTALSDKDPTVRIFAAHALWQVSRDVRAITTLADALKVKDDVWIAYQAAYFLEQLGPDAKAAVPALIASLKLKGYPNMPASAERALKAIDQEAASKAGVE